MNGGFPSDLEWKLLSVTRLMEIRDFIKNYLLLVDFSVFCAKHQNCINKPNFFVHRYVFNIKFIYICSIPIPFIDLLIYFLFRNSCLCEISKGRGEIERCFSTGSRIEFSKRNKTMKNENFIKITCLWCISQYTLRNAPNL